ncbi:MAG: N-6 DNA methylase [Bacteroidota bacterium]
MISNSELQRIIARYGIRKLERHLVFSYLERSGLDYKKSPILYEYLKDLHIDNPLYQKIQTLSFASIKDLENQLELLIPSKDRRINGAHFTPSLIVRYIIKQIAPKIGDANLDPSCGSGAFLIGLLEYYIEKYGKSVKAIIRENIYGADILDYNIQRTKLLLATFALQHNEILLDKDFNLYHHDSLRAEWKQRFDNIVGNPPYVKFQDLSAANRKFLASKWATIQNGTFNLYFAFFELGYNLLKENGKLGFITPNNYFTSLAGEPLRNFFTINQCVSRIVDFSHKKVFDAQTYTAITFLTKSRNTVVLYDRISDHQEPSAFLAQVNGSPNDLAALNPKKWRLLKSQERKIIETIESIGTPIGRLFDIAVGIATLKDDLYFLDSQATDGTFYVKSIYGKTFRIEKAITRPVYKVSDFKRQEDIPLNTRRIIVPYLIRNGVAIAIPEAEFKHNFPECYSYFCHVKANLLARDKGKAPYQPFYAWGRTQGLTRTGKKIVTPTFSQLPRFLIIEDEEAFFTNGYAIYFRTGGQESFFADATANPLASVENRFLVQKILNSGLMHFYVSKTSVSIEGGYPCYQKNFIEKFTIPHFNPDELTTLAKLQDRREIDSFLVHKYGLDSQFSNLDLYVAKSDSVKPSQVNPEIVASLSDESNPSAFSSASLE